MSRAPDQVWSLSKTLTLCEYKGGGYKGFWLYDATRGMNLSMRAPSNTDALLEALAYYQQRLTKVETEHRVLREKVDAFVEQFTED